MALSTPPMTSGFTSAPNRSGKWDRWRMPADGAGPNDKLAEKITNGDTQDWFPHISPDGRWLYTISYPMDHPDHTYIGHGMKIKLLRLDNGVAAKVPNSRR